MTFNPLELHHLYVGLLLVALGLILRNWWIGIAGAIIAVDDIYQHLRQVKQPDYRSPLHRTFQWCWHKVFGKWADAIWARIFGGL